jgi:hypothetical protein
MIALFTGVVALALGVQMTQNASAALAARTPAFDSYEVSIVAPAAQETQIRAALAAQGLSDYQVGYSTAVLSVTVAGATDQLPTRLLGQTAELDYSVSGAPWGSRPEGGYVPRFYAIRVGDTATVTLADGRVVNVPIVGAYQQNYATSLRFEDGLLVPAATSLALTAPTTVLLYVEAPNNPAAVTAALGQALPDATVVNMVAYAARYTENYRNLFLLAVVMAGLALLAGVLLVANSVSLAMLDRRYEIGVLKAVGYTRAHILSTLAAEYGLMAFIATGAALAFVQAFLMFVSLAAPVASRLLYLDPAVALAILVIGVGLTLLTVVVTTWGPTQVSPVVVLNERG